MEVEQVMAHLLAEIRASREKMHANQAEMKTNQGVLARVETKKDVNLKEMKEEIRTYEAKADTTLKEMKEELMARLEAKIEAEIKASNEKFEVIQSTLISLMDIHQARTETIQ
jgi:DNA-binding transcriptional regulator YbjK